MIKCTPILVVLLFIITTNADAYTFKADPHLLSQHWAQNLNISKAWRFASGKDVRIASCDNGVYFSEPDLRSNLLLEYAKDFSDLNNPDTIDDGSYTSLGTAAAAIMVGVKNGYGTNGIAWNAKLAPLQFRNNNRNDIVDLETALYNCLKYASQIPNIKVIYTSATYQSGTIEIFDSIKGLIRQITDKNITVVIPAGNSFNKLSDNQDYETNSIIVGSLRQNDQKSSFSNYGDRVTISSYGEGIATLKGPNGLYGLFTGTQAAAAQVAGTIALMYEAHPSLTPSAIRKILQHTALRTSENASVGGRVQTDKAVEEAARYFYQAVRYNRISN